MVQNPKDVAVSYFNFHISLKFAKNVDWPTFASWFLSGEVSFGSYLDHVLSWWEHRDEENVLFLKYEDMKKDVRSAIVRIASFIGKDLTEEEMEIILRKSSFSYMKNDHTANHDWIPKERKHAEATPFIRKSVVGDWKDMFTLELSGQFDARFTHKLKAAGLKLDFD